MKYVSVIGLILARLGTGLLIVVTFVLLAPLFILMLGLSMLLSLLRRAELNNDLDNVRETYSKQLGIISSTVRTSPFLERWKNF